MPSLEKRKEKEERLEIKKKQYDGVRKVVGSTGGRKWREMNEVIIRSNYSKE